MRPQTGRLLGMRAERWGCVIVLTMLIEMRKVKSLGSHRLRIEFSNGTVGERDFAFVREKTGPMAQPLKDPVYFTRVFIDDGALTWPNGYDWDPIALHDEMKDAGELRRVGDAAW